jgi:hypothetical protein
VSKVFGMHMIALRPGVKPEDFERFVNQKVYPAYSEALRIDGYLLKGDRGDREGKYLMVFEFPSVEARDRLFPSPSKLSEQAQQLFARSQKLFEEWATFATPLDAIYTDYVAVGK